MHPRRTTVARLKYFGLGELTGNKINIFKRIHSKFPRCTCKPQTIIHKFIKGIFPTTTKKAPFRMSHSLLSILYSLLS